VERLPSIVRLFGFPFREGLFNKAPFRPIEHHRAEHLQVARAGAIEDNRSTLTVAAEKLRFFAKQDG
jgi:hypothetical protein